MLNKSKIALSFAAFQGATLVSLTTQALAQNPYPDRGRYDPAFKSGRTDKLQMNLDQSVERCSRRAFKSDTTTLDR